ncbi:MAG: hypothetical protein ACP5KH_00120 [Thermodesulfovibrio sp.]
MVSGFASPKLLITGNEAIGFGAIASGLKFYSAYPMTPSTGIFNFVSENAKDFGIVVEQADLLFSLYAGHGEFPKVIFAPGSPEQAIYLTNKAFDLAEKYQITAIILTDQYLADSQCCFRNWSGWKVSPLYKM